MFFFFKYLFLFLLFNFLSNKKLQLNKGIGIFLIYSLLDLIFIDQNIYTFLYCFISILSIIYFIDDISGLSSIFRILLQTFLGLTIFFFYFESYNYLIIILIISSIIAVNVLNFQDGSDLNISSYILQFIILSYLVGDWNYSNLSKTILLNISFFIIIFSYFNYKKKFFFGDSGCFIFAFILITLLVDNFSINQILLTINVFLFAFVDSIFVILYRIYKKENLLTRNHYHLYHLIEKKYQNKTYLIPPLVSNSLLFLIQINTNLSAYSYIIIFSSLTIANYFFFRKVLS